MAFLLGVFLAAAGSVARAELVSEVKAASFEGEPFWYISSENRFHFGYLTRLTGEDDQQEEAWFVDGRENGGGAPGTIGVMQEGGRQPHVTVELSPDGKRLAYLQLVFDEEGRRRGAMVAVNGKAGKVYDAIHSLVLSPDGSRMAYAARREEQWRVILDGAEGPALEHPGPNSLAFNRSGAALAYLGNPGGGQSLMLNHKPVQPWPGGTITLSPDWQRLASTVYGEGKTQVEIDGAKLGRPYRFVTARTFSPSGRRFAFFGQDGEKGPYRAVIDGVEVGPPLDEVKIDDVFRMYFPPDGEAAHWFGKSEGVWRLYIEGEAQPGAWDIIQGRPALAFSPSGKHWAYSAIRGRQVYLVIDGKAEPASPFVFFPASGIAFDNEDEFHFLKFIPEESVHLVCGAVGPSRSPRLCPEKARKAFPKGE